MTPTTSTATTLGGLRPLDRRTAATLAATENDRFVGLLRTLPAEAWSAPTECPGWDVRAMASHVLGMMEMTTSLRELVHVQRAGARAANGRAHIDGMTEVQVRERAGLSPQEILDRLGEQAPRAARARRRLPAPLRRLPVPSEVGGVAETWRLGYLYDAILTRDVWMHRVDLTRATGRPLELTREHDGRLVADVAAEWSRRHGRPVTLTLTGPAGGTFTAGGGGEQVTLDAVEFCRILSGRVPGTGLLAQPVPF